MAEIGTIFAGSEEFGSDSGVLRAVIRDFSFGKHVFVQQHALRGNQGNSSDLVPFALRFHHFAVETDKISVSQSIK